MELSREAPAPAEDVSQPASTVEALRDDICEVLGQTASRTDRAVAASNVLQMLINSGHVLPGAPPAAKILEDARQFAAKLTLSNLALRILNMLAFSNVQTPETKPARQWIDDYLEGRNHGPVGHPMLWPGKMPGMASMLRDWGFIPTIAHPGQPSYVAKAVKAPTVQ